MHFLYAILSILVVALSQLIFKRGVSLLSQKEWAVSGVAKYVAMVFQPHIFWGLALNGLAAALWLLALSKLELSYIFPFLSLNYLLIPVGAAIFLKESLSPYRIAGICIICLGLFFIAFS